MRRLALGLAILTASAAGAEEPAASSLRDRIRALSAPVLPAPSPGDIYAEDIASDLALIGSHAGALFGSDGQASIALFTGPDCPACAQAGADLAAVLAELGLSATVLDVSDPANAALMAALTLDTLPSYVMPDRLIRGEMPAFVLHRYLSEAE